MELIYKASKHGFDGKLFHNKCDEKGPTITIIRSQHNHVFGGFTNQSWDSKSKFKKDNKAWIYVLRAKKEILSKYSFHLPLTFDIKRERNAIYCHSDCGPCFGQDIIIFNNSNVNSNSYSWFPWNYYQIEKRDKIDIITGSHHFKTLEMEVFKLL